MARLRLHINEATEAAAPRAARCALTHPERLPVDRNRTAREMLLPVPGLSTKTVEGLVQTRRIRALRSADLRRLRVPIQKVLPLGRATDAPA